MDTMELIKTLNNEFFNVLKKVNFSIYNNLDELISDCMQETAINVYEDLSIDDLYAIAYKDINEKIRSGQFESLNEICVEVCIEYLESTIDLVKVNNYLKEKNEVYTE